MKSLVLFFVLTAALFSGGCANYGTKDLDNVGKYVSLRPGISTKKEVHETFGQPGDVVYQGTPAASASYWAYFGVFERISGWTYVPYVALLAGGSRQEKQQSIFHFDAKGRYQRVQTSKDSDYVNQWAGIVRNIHRSSTDAKPQRVEQEMARIGKPFDKKFAKRLATVREEKH